MRATRSCADRQSVEKLKCDFWKPNLVLQAFYFCVFYFEIVFNYIIIKIKFASKKSTRSFFTDCCYTQLKKMKRQQIISLLIILLNGQILFSQINQANEIPDETLEMEFDIDIEPTQLSYKEIENLYLEFQHFKNIPFKKSIFPNLKLYFKEMEKGIHPFEIFEDETFLELHADTSDLRIFMEEIKIEYDKSNPEMRDYELTKEELIKHVKLAINPAFKNWILFKNGTYIIIEDTSEEKEIELQGVKKMKKFGPVHVGKPAGDFGTISLNKTKGWVVSGHGYGMYTYVHPTEIENENPQDHEIGLYGRSKRDLDGLNPEIIYLSSKGKIIEK